VSADALTEPARRILIAHRGGAGRAPENTLHALAGAAALGAEAVELDVRLSRDGEVVVIHDPTVDRTTNAAGRVRDMTATALARLDAGARFTSDGGRTFPFRGRGIGVPRLDEVLSSLRDIPLLIEVKEPAALRPVVDLLQRHAAVDRCVVASSEHAGVAPARGGTLRTGASTRDAVELLLSLRGPVAVPFDALCIPPRHYGIPLPMRTLVDRARRAGAVTHVWTVNDAAEARHLWSIGVTGIITDVPDEMVAVRDAMGTAAR
jgi:glycerophosphoryl diester phosphodiesterase